MSAGDAQALMTAATAAHQAGRLDEAEALYRQALEAGPAQLEPAHRLGLIALATGRPGEAVVLFRRVLAHAPDQLPLHLQLAQALSGLGRVDEALAVCQRAALMAPASPHPPRQRAGLLAGVGRLDEALAAYDAALLLAPEDPGVRIDRADLLQGLGRLEAALAGYDAALALDPASARAWSNRGVALQGLNRPTEAVESYDRALALQPGFVDALVNRGTALRELNRLEESIAGLAAAVAAAPDHPAARVNLGVSQLLAGDLPAGFRGHEARWRVEPTRSLVRDFTQPLWLGEGDIAGKTLLLHGEQGFGDTIQFCRYAPMAKARGAWVVLEVQPALKALMASLDGVDELVGAGEPLPAFDLHCPMMSLPLAFGTTLETIPAAPAYLAAPPERLAVWAEAVPPSPRLKVGLVWFGKPTHNNDRNRSLRLEQVIQALPEGAELFSLQDRTRPEDAAALAANPRIHRFDGRLRDFADTAALAARMDLVVSVDTSVAHLAAATGRPTWLLLPFAPDWRWLLGRADSPWYPTLRLFRQPAIGDWDSVMMELGEALADRVLANP